MEKALKIAKKLSSEKYEILKKTYLLDEKELDTKRWKDWNYYVADIIYDYLNTIDYDADNIHEYADGMVDIYYCDIYKSVSIFHEYINQSQEEFGPSETIDKQIQTGQYLFYVELGNEILDLYDNL